jgi:hypothetical protein
VFGAPVSWLIAETSRFLRDGLIRLAVQRSPHGFPYLFRACDFVSFRSSCCFPHNAAELSLRHVRIWKCREVREIHGSRSGAATISKVFGISPQ